MIGLIILVVFLLAGSASVTPRRSRLSEYELNRRLEAKLAGSLLDWRRSELYDEVMTLRRIVTTFWLLAGTTLLIVRFGWAGGFAGAIVLILIYSPLAAFGPLHALVQARYDRHEAGLLRWVEKHRRWISWLRGVSESSDSTDLASRPELLHMVDQAGLEIISRQEKKMIHGALSFDDKRVKDHMTPRSQMEVIGVNELLGPLVLDDLHKTGHSHFPVLDGDIDHIVGVLHLHNLLTLINRRSVTVGEVMEPKTIYIHEDQPLAEALSTCIKLRRHLLVVINDREETVGVITVEDAVSQLIGGPVIDRFDDHDDRRRVASRQPSDSSTTDAAGDPTPTVVE